MVAVAGLLAQTGRTLRQAEYAALAALAGLPREELAALLLSADRFLVADPGKAPSLDDQVSSEARQALLDRFGLFGVRLSVTLIRQGTGSPSALASELVNRSGLVELREVLTTQFTARRDLVKVRCGLLAVETALRQADARPDTRALEAEVEHPPHSDEPHSPSLGRIDSCAGASPLASLPAHGCVTVRSAAC